jgi:hypothetical protein
MKRYLAVALGILTAIGGLVDIGDLVTNAIAGSRFGLSLGWVVVRLDVPRDGALRQPRDEGTRTRRRLGDLLDADVVDGEGTALGRVLDVRLEPEHLPEARLRVVALVVGLGRPGTTLEPMAAAR